METKKWTLRFYLLLFCSVIITLPVAASINFSAPSHGCYWNVTCQDRWLGECGMGHSIFGHSNDCDGLCPEPEYTTCPPPYHTRFYCCIPEHPKVTIDWCTNCDDRVDNGDDYTCCTDCSNPRIISNEPKLGVCQSGAEILVQPKPKEPSTVFKWVTGPWKPCSSPCDGGIRYRDVNCYAVIEDTLVPDYPVYDHKCSAEEIPVREEPCDFKSCLEELNDGDFQGRNHSHMPIWELVVLIMLGIVVIGSIGFAGYVQYKRRTSMQYGDVYIMMEGYL